MSEWFRELARDREDVAGRFDLEAARPTDYGQTLQFGGFEVAVGAVLHGFTRLSGRRGGGPLAPVPRGIGDAASAAIL